MTHRPCLWIDEKYVGRISGSEQSEWGTGHVISTVEAEGFRRCERGGLYRIDGADAKFQYGARDGFLEK